MRQTDGQTDFTTASAVLHYVAWPKIVKIKCEKHLYAQMTTKQNIKKFRQKSIEETVSYVTECVPVH